MTDVTTEQGQDGVELSAADEQLLRELTERARTGGLKLTGEGGLLGKLTKMVVEGALEGELDDHLGYEKNDPAGRNGGNSRNGYRGKTVLTEAGPVEISVPRDRDSSFEPVIVAKRQRRLTGVDDLVISLSAKGLTHGEISAHLAVAAEPTRRIVLCRAPLGTGVVELRYLSGPGHGGLYVRLMIWCLVRLRAPVMPSATGRACACWWSSVSGPVNVTTSWCSWGRGKGRAITIMAGSRRGQSKLSVT
jgi:hypothetical protein